MVRNLTQPTFFASITPPNPVEITYWIDLGANARGNIIKFWDGNINQWVKLTDASSEYAVSPKIGLNGNWFVDNRDTGIPAYGYVPIIGDNGNWWEWSSEDLMYKDTGHSAVGETGATGPTGAEGKSAYASAIDSGFVGTESEWIASLSAASEEAAVLALAAQDAALRAANDANAATVLANTATSNANVAASTATLSAAGADHAADGARVATVNANTAISLANAAANSANTAATSANLAATTANAAAVNADNAVSEILAAIETTEDATEEALTAANVANTAASSVNTAISDSQAATSAANTAATNANNAAQTALDAAANVKDGKTPTFGEINTIAVPSDTAADFELTNTGQVDEDGNPIWIGNLSIPSGENGKAPLMEAGTITTGNPGTNASFTLTDNGTTADGRPKYLLSLTIPRGAQGEPGEGSGNVVLTNYSDGEMAKQYVIRPGANGSLNYSIEEIEVDGPQQLSVVYVSKAGNDSNHGRSFLKPKATIASAITAASGLIGGQVRQASVIVMDAGTYTETVSLVDDVHLIAERATIVGRINLRNRTRVSVYSHYPAASSTYLVYKDGTEHAYYNAVVSDGRGMDGTLTTVTNFYNITSSSITFVDVQLMYVSANGIGIREESSTYGHVHFNIKDLYLAGNAATAIRASGTASNIIGYFDHILETSADLTNTTAIDIRQEACIVKVIGGEIIADKLWNIVAGKLYMTCPKVEGTKTGSATNFISGDYGDLKNAPTWNNSTGNLNVTSLNVGNITQTGVSKLNKSDIKIYENVASYIVGNERITGVIKIGFPIGFNNTMFRITLDLADRSTSVCRYVISAFAASSNSEWLLSHAKMYKLGNGFNEIRLGNDNGKACILLGGMDISMDAPKITISKVEATYLGSYVDLSSGWTIGPIADESGITNIVSPKLVSRTLNPDEVPTKLKIPSGTIPFNSASGAGEPLSYLAVSSGETIGYSIARRTETGKLKAVGATENNEVIVKSQLDSAVTTINSAVAAKADTTYVNSQLAGKSSVFATTGYSVPYNNTSAVGEPLSSIKVSDAAENSTIARRTATGQVQTATPTANTHAATKLYVDSAISSTGNTTISNPDDIKAKVPTVLTSNADATTTFEAQEAFNGGRNLKRNYNSPDSFSAYSGATLTKTVEAVTEWGATDANRIVSSGGDGVLKAIMSLEVIPPSRKRIASIYVKNNSDKPLTVHSNMGAMTDTVNAGELKIVRFRYTTTGTQGTAQFQFRAPTASDNIDVTWWRAMFEEGHIPSTPVPAVEDMVAKSDVVNNLTSTSTDVPLSANQGKVLQDTKGTKLSIPQNGVPSKSTTGTGEPNTYTLMSSTATNDSLVLRTSDARVKAAIATELDDAVTLAQLNERFSGNYEIVTTLPAVGVAGKMYLVTSGTENVYQKWIYVTDGGTDTWKDLGSTFVDLSNYATTASMNNAINSAKSELNTKIDTKVTAVAGKDLSTNDFTNDLKAYLTFMLTAQSLTTVVNIPSTAANTEVSTSANETLSIANPTNLKPGYVMTIRVNNTAAAERTITLPSSTTWVNDYGTELRIAADSRAEVSIWCYKDGYYSIRVGEV